MAMVARVEVVGARLFGHTSRSTEISSQISACLANVDLPLPVIAMILLPKDFRLGISLITSSVSPL
ncbi:hypothetical protein D3C81_2210370 [compost metagenome]